MNPHMYSLKFSPTISIVQSVLVVCAFMLLVPVAHAQATAPKRVVVLYWDNKEFPGNVRFEESFKAQLQLDRRQNVEYFPEYFEASRFPEENTAVHFRNYLQAKYAHRSVDVVVASADAPLEFLLQYRNELFAKSPIVFVANELPKPDALAAAAGMHPLQSFGQNPATLLDRQAAAGVKGTTTLSWVTEKTVEKAVLTFPVPDVPGATATATLVNYLPESVVVKNGNDTHEFIYGKWGDFNNPLFKIEALMPGTTVERKNGAAVRNVTTKVTEIGQIYVIVPVPESVQKAGK